MNKKATAEAVALRDASPNSN